MKSEGFKPPKGIDTSDLKPCLLCYTKGKRKGGPCLRCNGYGWLDNHAQAFVIPNALTQTVKK